MHHKNYKVIDIYPPKSKAIKSAKALPENSFSLMFLFDWTKKKNLLDRTGHLPYSCKCAKKQTQKRPSPHRLEA